MYRMKWLKRWDVFPLMKWILCGSSLLFSAVFRGCVVNISQPLELVAASCKILTIKWAIGESLTGSVLLVSSK